MYEWLCTKTCFDTEAKGNSEMAGLCCSKNYFPSYVVMLLVITYCPIAELEMFLCPLMMCH